jgi:HAE1 family hydrophobic/amphiphilic exporter-1
VVVALILTPVLCAPLLKQVPAGHQPADAAVFFLRPFFRWFDRLFYYARDLYLKLVGHSLARRMRYLLVFMVITAIMGFMCVRMPTAYLPEEDQGILYVQALLPANSTLEQTEKVLEKVREHFLQKEGDAVESCLTVAGFSFSGRGQNAGLAWVKLKDWKLRDRPDLRVEAVVGRSMGVFSKIRNAMVFAFPPPAVIELGQAKGFDFRLLDRGGLGHENLMAASSQLLDMAAQDPRLTRVRFNGLEDVPQYRIDVDWDKAGALGVPIAGIHSTISAAFGSAYVNNFIHKGRVKRVYVQADAPYRMLPQDLEKLYVRNNAGKMVPFSAFASGYWITGPPKLERYNGFASLNIWGEPAAGRSSGEAMQAMENFVARLPQGVGYDWAGLSYQERIAGSQAPLLYAFSIFVIFLCLAALYESWPIPLSILLTLPLGAIGGVVATTWVGLPNDVYFQIGLLTILGLTTKNAILIVQFARARVDEGMGLIDATLEGAKLRLRPIVMTSLAFGFGVLPLALASGAGAGAQKAIGIGVLGGVVTSTFLVTLFAPLFYVLIYRALGKHRRREKTQAAKTSLSESR